MFSALGVGGSSWPDFWDLDSYISLLEAVAVHLWCFLIHYLCVYVIIDVSLIQHLITVSSNLSTTINVDLDTIMHNLSKNTDHRSVR